MTRLQIPPDLAPLLRRIDALAGGRAYAVGGTVRDLLLRRPLRDIDVALAGDARSLARVLATALGGSPVTLDDANGVARVAVSGGAMRHIDVAALQGDLDTDLRRRDLTIDAMAAPLSTLAVIDPLGGQEDLRRRLVRMTAPAVFDADPLRLLRAVRIAAELSFDIDPATERELRQRARDVDRAAAERRRDELAHMLALPDTYHALNMLDRYELLDVVVPELAGGRGVSQPGEFHAYDVFEHNMRTVEALDALLAPDSGAMELTPWLAGEFWHVFDWHAEALAAYLAEPLTEGRPRGALLKLAGLLHDVAKPQTREVQPGGRVRFFGHADLGAAVASRVMRRLRFSSRETAFVRTLVAEHLRPVQLAAVGRAPTRRAIYRYFRDLGEAAIATIVLALADSAAARGPSLTRAGWLRQVTYMNSVLVRSVKEEGIVHPPRLLDGRDVMAALGLPQGRRIGELLEALREAQAAGEVTDREDALAFLRKEHERLEARQER